MALEAQCLVSFSDNVCIVRQDIHCYNTHCNHPVCWHITMCQHLYFNANSQRILNSNFSSIIPAYRSIYKYGIKFKTLYCEVWLCLAIGLCHHFVEISSLGNSWRLQESFEPLWEVTQQDETDSWHKSWPKILSTDIASFILWWLHLIYL